VPVNGPQDVHQEEAKRPVGLPPWLSRPKPIKPKLMVVDGHATKDEIDLKLPMTIGREQGLGLVISHPLVSRRHCQLTRRGEVVFLKDLDSANGTTVNGQRVKEVALKPGDKLTIGPLTFIVVYQPSSKIPVPSRQGGARTVDSRQPSEGPDEDLHLGDSDVRPVKIPGPPNHSGTDHNSSSEDRSKGPQAPALPPTANPSAANPPASASATVGSASASTAVATPPKGLPTIPAPPAKPGSGSRPNPLGAPPPVPQVAGRVGVPSTSGPPGPSPATPASAPSGAGSPTAASGPALAPDTTKSRGNSAPPAEPKPGPSGPAGTSSSAKVGPATATKETLGRSQLQPPQTIDNGVIVGSGRKPSAPNDDFAALEEEDLLDEHDEDADAQEASSGSINEDDEEQLGFFFSQAQKMAASEKKKREREGTANAGTAPAAVPARPPETNLRMAPLSDPDSDAISEADAVSDLLSDDISSRSKHGPGGEAGQTILAASVPIQSKLLDVTVALRSNKRDKDALDPADESDHSDSWAGDMRRSVDESQEPLLGYLLGHIEHLQKQILEHYQDAAITAQLVSRLQQEQLDVIREEMDGLYSLTRLMMKQLRKANPGLRFETPVSAAADGQLSADSSDSASTIQQEGLILEDMQSWLLRRMSNLRSQSHSHWERVRDQLKKFGLDLPSR